MPRRLTWIAFSFLFLTLLARTVERPRRTEDGAPVRAGTASGIELRAPAERDGFSFVLFGDRTTGDQAGLKVLEEGVAMANRLDPDFVLTVGDLIQGYGPAEDWLREMREYKGIVSRLDAPWYPVAGNHDVYGERGRAGGNVELFQQHFGPLYYSFDYRWAHFVVLFTDEALSFSNPPEDQNMSAAQLAWLRADLAASGAEHVFVLVHHPRWTAPYAGSNWPEVHEVLKSDGRVRAVFGGHQHRYRDDGEIDGIHHYVLAVTGGRSGPYKQSADMQHIAHVRVRREGYEMAVLPVGGVLGDDMILGAEVDEMVALGAGAWVAREGAALVARAQARESSFEVRTRNPLGREAAFRLELPEAEGWSFRVGEPEVTLAPGAEHAFEVTAFAPPFRGEDAELRWTASLQLELQSGVVQPVRIERAVPIGFDAASGLDPAPPERALVLDGTSSVRVPLDWSADQLTLELWVRGEAPPEWVGLVSRTQSSGFSLNWGPGGPTGSVRLWEQAGYTTAETERAPGPERWTHLAFVWDGLRARLYVDGALEDDVEARGRLRDNSLPLFVGADTNRAGEPEHSFRGWIDEVRVSTVARYAADFRPARRHEPDADTALLLHFDDELMGVFPDSSGRSHHGWPRGRPRLEPVQR